MITTIIVTAIVSGLAGGAIALTFADKEIETIIDTTNSGSLGAMHTGSASCYNSHSNRDEIN